MSRFIPIQLFSSLYTTFADLLTEEGVHDFINKIEGDEANTLINELGISQSELLIFKNSVRSSQVVLFHGWVDENQSLKELILNGKLQKFEDSSNHLKHQYLDDFKVFISSFLSNQLLKYSGESDLDILEKVFSFVSLLDKDHRPVVEDKLFSSIQSKVATVTKKSKSLHEESDLIEVIKPLCDDRIIACVNSLSRASYAYKMQYVDDILNVLKFKSCTPRFANWTLKKLELIELNNEHEYKIKDLKTELKEGELKVRNHGKGRTPIKWGSLATLFLTLMVSGVVFWIVKYKPFSEVEDPQFTNDTSFMQFSKEERMKIDSLLVSLNGNLNDEDLMLDHGIPLIGQSDQLILRKSFINPTIERIYQDFLKDANIREGKVMDSCVENTLFEPITGTNDLLSSAGNVKAMIKNESQYDALIIVGDDGNNGKVYSMLLKKGETKSFSINDYDQLIVIPGNKYQKYSTPPGISKDELPSEKFKHFFCEIDYNYKNGINTAYQLIRTNNGNAKLLLMGDKGGTFHLVDINGVLEKV